MKKNTYQTPFLSEIESGKPIPIGKLAYLRERTRLRLYDFIVSKFLEQSKKTGLTQAELGRRIRRKPEVINRWLGAPGNWTIDTIADLLVGISAEELDPQSISLLNRLARNQTIPEWWDEVRSRNLEEHKPKSPGLLGYKTARKPAKLLPNDKRQPEPEVFALPL